MEAFMSEMDRNGSTMDSEPSNRISSRPPVFQPGRGAAHQDLGSSFGFPRTSEVPAWQKGRSDPLTIRRKDVDSRTRKYTTHDTTGISDEDSDDSMLLCDRYDREPFSNQNIPTTVIDAHDDGVVIGGSFHKYHEDFKPKVLPKFTKKKNTDVDTSSDDSLDKECENKALTQIPYLAQISQSSSSTRKLTTSRDTFRSSPLPDLEGKGMRQGNSPVVGAHSMNGEPNTLMVSNSPQLTSGQGGNDSRVPFTSSNRPKSRPRMLQPSDAQDSRGYVKPSSPRRSRRLQDLASDNPCVGTSRMNENNQVKRPMSQREVGTVSHRQVARPFPMDLLTTKENIYVAVEGTSKRPRKKTANRVVTFPVLSPLSSQSTEAAESFPMPSPLSSPVKNRVRPRNKGKGKARDKDSCENDPPSQALPDKKKSELQPFPMDLHEQQSEETMFSHAMSDEWTTSWALSKDGKNPDDGRERKRVKGDDDSLLLRSLDIRDASPMEETSLYHDSTKDPTTLCPYCDEVLPDTPTSYLLGLLASATTKSQPDPRATNRLGLKAPLATFIAACQRHRFEIHHLPEAEAKGWPREIAWEDVPRRVTLLKPSLREILNDSHDIGTDWGKQPNNTELANKVRAREVKQMQDVGGPREKSVFWREVKSEVKKRGSRAAMGVSGQFANFEKTQPGYYGEIGFIIIHQALYSMFPPSSIDPALIEPLSPTEFIQRILVPEAAVALIMEDLQIDRESAVKTLRESVQYGVAMFPDVDTSSAVGDQSDDDDMGVADQIVMERARLRRMELEEEERIEEAMEKEAMTRRNAGERSRKRDAKKPFKRKRKGKSTEEESEFIDVTDEGSQLQRSRRARRQVPGRATRFQTVSTTESDAYDSAFAPNNDGAPSGIGVRVASQRTNIKTAGLDMNVSLPTHGDDGRRADSRSDNLTTRRSSPDINFFTNTPDVSCATTPRPLRHGSWSNRIASKYVDGIAGGASVDANSGELHSRRQKASSRQEKCHEVTPGSTRTTGTSLVPTAAGQHSTLSRNRFFFPLQEAHQRDVASSDPDLWQQTMTAQAADDSGESSASSASSTETYAWLLSDDD